MADLQGAVQALLDELVESGEGGGASGRRLCWRSAGGGLRGGVALTGSWDPGLRRHPVHHLPAL